MEELYDAESEVEVTLKDGSAVTLRPVRRGDFEDLCRLYTSMSRESLLMRFFTLPCEKEIEEYLRTAVELDDRRKGFGIVALSGDRIVGHAEYRASGDSRAEVAFVVSEDFQGKGLATIMLGALAEEAERNGIKMFEAYVRSDNYRMVDVFKDSGFPVSIRPMPGEIYISMPTAITEEVMRYFERREVLATLNALKRFFYPKSVAVIGASTSPQKVGGRTFYNIITYGFKGVAYPVNARSRAVMGVKAYRSVSEIPDEVDLAIICVPVDAVLSVAEECGKKGVKALVVITSGFAEVGGNGVKRQEELLKICQKYGMRLIGPNCMGILCTDPEIRLHATFAPNPPVEGHIGFASQSGAMGLAIMDRANYYDLGLSAYVSLGNRADISSNDLIEYWEEDERTRLIMLYLESFGNARRFARIAKRVSKKKPILALASGLTPAGAKAVASHTGSIVASSGIAVEALFRQTGVIRASSLDELFAISSFLLHQPLPKGRNVCIMTNGGGLGAVTSDWCEKVGLSVPDLSEETQKKLRALLPDIASVRNPVDMTPAAKMENYEAVLKTIADDESVDAIIVVFVQAVSGESSEVIHRAILSGAEYANNLGKPVIYIHISEDASEGVLGNGKVKVPVYIYPNTAAKVLGKVVEYAKWRMRPEEPYPQFDVDRGRAASIIADALSIGEEWLRMDRAFELLRCYGVRFPEYRFARTPEEVAYAAREIGGRVALKAVSEKIVHKSDVGAVKLNLTPEDAYRAAQDMLRKFGDVDGFLVQKMSEGVEMFVGVVEDPHFGPLITCGAGGTLVEIFKDVSVRVTPITESEAREMVHELKSYPLLTGYRGREKVDVDSFIETILRICCLIEDFPEISEMDCNPVMVSRDGSEVVDVRIRLRK
ncbi:MAG: GNAT family N-acetyltransferase [Archaeoglobi archaeon]|nr:GNAT family N-acetyltransferase [Archaeoglobi archaeon]